MKTKVAFVGGFLGAGKTTLLFEAARRFSERGKRVGLITNDQAPELVDTAYLQTAGLKVEEVSGSCFCCNFKGLIGAIGELVNAGAQLIIAEPVGSCTDLSATILQPIKERFGGELEVAALCVLADPEKLFPLLGAGTSALHGSALYIMEKQLEEADAILINKTDLLPPESVKDLIARCEQKWPQARVLALSAGTGDGVQGFMELIEQSADGGTHIAPVDYDVYAEGEAVLGWLNLKAVLKCDSPDWNAFAESLLTALGKRFDAMNLPVGHVKLLLRSGAGHAAGNITGKSPTLRFRGGAGAEPDAVLILNARVQTGPEPLKSLILEELQNACGGGIGLKIAAINCLSPGRPNPTYRYDRVVRG